jgi:hypothetical protein
VSKNKIILLQVWIGKIPDYFWYHYETTKNINNIDFLFITDQTDLILDAKNYKVIFKKKEEIESLLREKLQNTDIEIRNNKKICDLKASLGDLFFENINEYEYFGVYDIDTLFGNMKEVFNSIDEGYDVISFGDDLYHNRISGPFIIFRNNEEIRKFYKHDDFILALEKDNVVCYEEQDFYQRLKQSFNIKIIQNQTNVEIHNGGKLGFNSFWSAGNLYVDGIEKSLFHFYRKNETKLVKTGNIISSYYDKKIIDDFYWVIHFSENYEKFLPSILESIKKYSNRKCILYSINYFPKIAFELQYNSDQFLFKRIDIPKGNIDYRGRDFNILTSKPLILLDVINSFPGKKFVHIDMDIYLTTNSDNIVKYFNYLDEYPLANSHVHDVIYTSNVIPGEEWTSTLHVLLREEKITNDPIFPRRKCNIIVFDERSKWFFQEQMSLYEKYINSNIPGILYLHDEDTFNSILAKYGLHKSLPLLDIEETHDINIEKINEYSYSKITTWLSPSLVRPESVNDFLFFHGFKDPLDYEKIANTYGNKVLDCEELIIKYQNNTLLFEKNTFLTTKKDVGIVDFVIKDLIGNEIFRLGNQNLLQYWVFYISNFYLSEGKYILEVYKKEDNHKIFTDYFQVK